MGRKITKGKKYVERVGRAWSHALLRLSVWPGLSLSQSRPRYPHLCTEEIGLVVPPDGTGQGQEILRLPNSLAPDFSTTQVGGWVNHYLVSPGQVEPFRMDDCLGKGGDQSGGCKCV